MYRFKNSSDLLLPEACCCQKYTANHRDLSGLLAAAIEYEPHVAAMLPSHDDTMG
jgi:hypothetical protein